MFPSSRPYLLKALYEWLLDNRLTPYVIVAADMDGVVVPRAHVQDGQLILNISPGATRDLLMDKEALAFSARFGGVAMQLHVPMDAVIAIYARENGVGMVFGQEPRLVGFPAMPSESAATSPRQDEGEAPAAPERPRAASHLKIIK